MELFSRRTEWELNPNQLIKGFKDLEHSGQKVLDLTESNPTRCQFQYVTEDLLQPFINSKNLVYDPSPKGLLEARQAICHYYANLGFTIDPKRVFLTASTSEAYSFLFKLLTNPKEKLLFPQPSYPLFQFLVDLNDAQLESYPLVYENQWKVDIKGLENAIQHNSKAVVIVNPNNPTGSYIKEEELLAINELCQKSKMAIICDEVFLDYQLEGEKKVFSLVNNKEVLTFVMGGLSKCLGMPQMKISWIIVNGPDDLVKTATERLEIISDTYLSVSTPAQNSLKDWINVQPKAKEEILARLKSNKEFLGKFIGAEDHMECLHVEGGWYGVLKLPDCKSEEEWVLELLKNKHVFVHPGYFFDFAEEPYIVLSLLTSEGTFQEGVRRIISQVKVGLANTV